MEQCGSAPLACPAVRIVARANRPCDLAVPWPCAPLVSHRHAHRRHAHRRTARAPSPRAPSHRPRTVAASRGRAHRPCCLAVGRDVPIAPPRHRRGARLCIPRPIARPLAVPSPRPSRAPASRDLSRRCRPHHYTRDHYTRALPGRRDRDIAPYRHYARDNRTLGPALFAVSRAPCAPHRRFIPPPAPPSTDRGNASGEPFSRIQCRRQTS